MNFLIAAILALSIICVTIVAVHWVEDPKAAAMRECARGWPDTERQIECARVIFGHDATPEPEGED